MAEHLRSVSLHDRVMAISVLDRMAEAVKLHRLGPDL
jgi:hypothetical protein